MQAYALLNSARMRHLTTKVLPSQGGAALFLCLLWALGSVGLAHGQLPAEVPGNPNVVMAAVLRRLDPFLPAVLGVLTVLGGARLMHQLGRYRRQQASRKALGLAGGLGPGDVVPGVPLALWLGAAGAALFAGWVAWAVGAGGPGAELWQRWDAWWQPRMATALPPSWVWPVRGVTELGGVLFTSALVVVVGVGLARRGRWQAMQLLLFFALFNGLVVRVLKLGFDRTRPEHLPELVVSGASFPSGHAAASLLVYGLLAMLLTAQLSERARKAWVVAAVLMAMGIGATRMLLSVHWFSDVVAGWALGLACWLAAAAIQRHLWRAQA